MVKKYVDAYAWTKYMTLYVYKIKNSCDTSQWKMFSALFSFSLLALDLISKHADIKSDYLCGEGKE